MSHSPRKLLTRRAVLGAGAAGLAGLGGYAGYIEPRLRLQETRWRFTPRGWPAGEKLTIAMVADIHACRPYMPPEWVAEIVGRVNDLRPDLIVLMGDYATSHLGLSQPVPPAETMAVLAKLEAPLGRYAILGNHDYWDGIEPFRAALAASGIPLLENRAVRIASPAGGFWLAGTASMIAERLGHRSFRGFEDIPGTLAQITDNAPLVWLAHEPDLFTRMPERVSLTLSGHTHGGQIRIPGIGAPFVPSQYGNRFAYGHIVEDGRDLVVSSGLGTSILPARFAMPPEITLVTLGG